MKQVHSVSSTKKRQRSEARSIDPPTYRRNRTMTDRSDLPEVSERAKIHRVRQLRSRVGAALLVVVTCVGFGAIGVMQYSGSIAVVSSSTELVNTVDTETYERIFTVYYTEHPLERFRFATDHNRLLSFLQQEAPEVQSVKPAGMQEIGVSKYEIGIRRPVASWTVDDRRYYVDAEGVTFTKNYYQEPSVRVIDNSGAAISQGAAIASSRLLSFVGRVVSLAEANSVAISSIEIPTQSMRQVSIKGKGMPSVRMTVDRPVEVQVNDMVQALRYFERRSQKPSYIDVRVEGKAFYR